MLRRRYETIKAADAVAALKASLKPTATVKRDGSWQNIDAKMLVPGDMVLLGAGSAIPADCLINDGRLEVDQSALTGESLPVTMYRGDSCKMGSTAVRGEVEATVEVRFCVCLMSLQLDPYYCYVCVAALGPRTCIVPALHC